MSTVAAEEMWVPALMVTRGPIRTEFSTTVTMVVAVGVIEVVVSIDRVVGVKGVGEV